MDAFELARHRHAKNLERKLRYEVKQEEPKAEEPDLPYLPKAKPRNEAIIEVKVILPDREIFVTMQKINVYENVNKSRLTQSEIKRCVENGFAPLMGRLNDVHRGG